MFLERVVLSGFRCFAPTPTTINFDPALTAFVGTNGSGKTALMQALLRLFGVTADQRSVRRQDFHVPINEAAAPLSRTLFIEAVVAFPELDDENGDHSAIPEFFNQLASDEQGHLKCRLRLDATWTDDGSLDGVIETKLFAVKSFGNFGDDDVIELKAIDRARIQMIYVPAVRDGGSQVTAFIANNPAEVVKRQQLVSKLQPLMLLPDDEEQADEAEGSDDDEEAACSCAASSSRTSGASGSRP